MSRKVCRESAIKAAEGRKAIPARIIAFMKKYNLNYKGMELVTGTLEQTVRKWADEGSLPPSCFGSLLTVLERSAEAREILGVNRYRMKKTQIPKRQQRQASTSGNKTVATNLPFDEALFVEGPTDMWEITVSELE